MSSPKSPIPADPPRLVDPARPWADPGLSSGAGLWEQQRRVRRTLAQTAAGLREGPWMPVDALVAAASIFVAHFSSPSYLVNPLGPRPLLVAAVHALSFVLTAYAVGLYDWNVLTRWGLVLGRGLLATALAVVPTLSFFYLVFYQPIGRVVIGLTILLSSLGVVLPRYVLWRVLQSRRRRVLFVRDSPLARATAGVLASEYKDLYEVVGPAAPPAPHESHDLPALCESLEVDEIVLPTDHGELPQLLLPALRCLPLRCRIRSEADFYEDVFRCVPVEHVSPVWILGGGWDSSNHVGEIVKRGLDAVLALGLLVLAAPLALVIVLAIVVSRDGPVFYVQTRVGRYGRAFRIVKFRTMRVDAEQGAAVWAQGDDPRQTGLGRLLRRSRLDELPQLANILLGEMSFVGPRPERPEFVGELEATLPYYSWRHLVRPGLTGWAQINYPYGGTVEDARRKLEFDLYYIRHSSPVMDLTIALRTVTALMRGAR